MSIEPGKSSCNHYQRKCSLVTPCCSKEYTCRICHDEKENHKLDRRSVKNIICLQCGKQQEVAKNCGECGILFGKYSCMVCRLYDDRDRKQFHCDGCGICRVDGRENFYHCPKCNMCITVNIKESHKCLEDVSRRNCPVCLEDIHTSRKSVHIPTCSHLLHSECFSRMMEHGQTSCPICNQSLVDMSSYWKALDVEVENTTMPEVYQNYRVNVLCRDCHKESKVLFHVIGLKCQSCGSYNTTRVGGDDPLPPGATDEVIEVTMNVEHSSSWETVTDEENDDDPIENFDDDVVSNPENINLDSENDSGSPEHLETTNSSLNPGS